MQLTIDLPEDVFKFIELRAAIDDNRPATAIEEMLIELVTAKQEQRPIHVRQRVF